ncbi:MAG: TIM barrel protein, partial [Caldilineaceae bacterium]|nr:TIM barrel protein [Caldilineaceae bacterium]
TGQIAKGGSDILEVMRTYRDRIVHVHLKDWNGSYERDGDGKEIDRSGYVNYEPIGNGILPMPEIFAILAENGGFGGWVNVELDGTSRAPRAAREAARMSREYLESVLGDDVAWSS